MNKKRLQLLIIIVLVILLILPTQIQNITGQASKWSRRTPISCEETDNGLDYNTKGTVTYTYTRFGRTRTRTYTDKCKDNKLYEYYCSNNRARVKIYTCPNSCLKGVCLKESQIPIIKLKDIIKINKNFNKDSEYLLTYPDKISHLNLNGNIKLKKDDSYVRVVLKDQNNKEYLVLEANPLFNDKIYKFTNLCEETCDVGAINIKSLIIELSDASIHIDSVNLKKGVIETGAKASRSKAEREKLRKEKQKEKISLLNKRIKENGLKWTAGETSVSKLTYEEKKKLFSKPDGTPVDKLPNLQGFEYYKGGIFEIKSEKGYNLISGSVVANSIYFPNSWDWRNVHGENWLTPVKNQGSAGTCWAFATLGALESHINLHYNQHLDVDLSEQMLVDCANRGPIEELSTLPEECTGNNMCYPGYNYCKILHNGIADEICDPYAQRSFTWDPSYCDYNHICSDWKNRVWKTSDFHDYKFVSDLGTPNCKKQTMDLSEEEFKKVIIKKGPMYSGITSWNHAMVLIGYEKDPGDKQTVWIFKNSWGTDWGKRGYGKVKLSLENMYCSLPIGPFIPPLDRSYWPRDFNEEINCVDKDKDSYCNWGISLIKPDTCPAFCKSEKDFDDSNAIITIPFIPGVTQCTTGGGTYKDYYKRIFSSKYKNKQRGSCKLEVSSNEYSVRCDTSTISRPNNCRAFMIIEQMIPSTDGEIILCKEGNIPRITIKKQGNNLQLTLNAFYCRDCDNKNKYWKGHDRYQDFICESVIPRTPVR